MFLYVVFSYGLLFIKKMFMHVLPSMSSRYLYLCRMLQSKKGLYCRSNNPYVEMEVSKDDSYSRFSLLAADKLSIPDPNNVSYEPVLFKVNGTMILDDDMTIRGCKKPCNPSNCIVLCDM